jgi:glycosyltransferase involved in cell wall biosynthesis
MFGVKYIAPIFDMSGYGEASRNYALALHKAGIPITLETVSFETNPPLVGTDSERKTLLSLRNKDIYYDVVIIHLTPDLAPRYIDQNRDKHCISYTVWETSKLHPKWVEACNQVAEVWVPCQWNYSTFKESGVTVPIYKIHHGIDPDYYQGINPNDFSLDIPNRDKEFIFYSIFQWNRRKNPDGLLRAYFNAFKNHDNVRLILKTYVGRGLPPGEDARLVKEAVGKIKADMQLPNLPKVTLINQSLSTVQMKQLHKYCDGYVLLPCGEGFSLTALEAGLAGNPVITTGLGGNMEYMTVDNSFPVNYMWDYVQGMSGFNQWYLGDQTWARADLIDAAEKMRYVYNNRGEAKERAYKLQERIKTEFSWDAVAKQMISRLKEIKNGL